MKLIIFWVNPFFVHHKSLDVRMSVGRLIGVGTFQNEKWNKTASLNRCLLPFLVFTLKKYLILIFITLPALRLQGPGNNMKSETID